MSSSSSTTPLVVTLRSRLSGFRMIRWHRMAGASRLMSSGVMNLSPGCRPVDLVGQDDLRKDRARPELELSRLRIENRSPGDVGWQQVRRALHPLERRPHAAGHRAGKHGLGHARYIFEQDVALGKIRDQCQNDLLALADDHFFDVADDFLADEGDVYDALNRSILQLFGGSVLTTRSPRYSRVSLDGSQSRYAERARSGA